MPPAYSGHHPRVSAENLAVAFIESATEWDFGELPEPVREKIVEGARAFLDFVSPSPQYPSITEGTE